ncbi:flavin reductase family protein [uncultured Tenacibaculum sp.]|uniref:flavin reductase family protein n=1 Tax=uncultured Tenacibaculum sp. TaxID=174713 RepID=UPI00260C4831|nr:flavin reductase [uncultured Tenacibaculum sp.]
MFFKKEDISGFDHIYKINLMNSLSGYKSANLIGSISPNGEENVAVFSSIVHLGSNPPLLGFILRPTTVPRNTYENIKETGFYTVNHITKRITEDAHHTSAKYDKGVSEFEMTNLTPEYKNNFIAPFVQESPVQIGMKYVEEYYIKANDTIMLVGEIQFFDVEDHMLQEDGFLNLSKGNVATINGLDGYAIPNLFTRYEYQRPKKIVEKL